MSEFGQNPQAKRMSPEITKIDTQGMSGPTDPDYKPTGKEKEHKPAVVTPR